MGLAAPLPPGVREPVELTSLVTATAGIARVEYYLGDRLIGSATQEPYAVTLDPQALRLSPGVYALTVKAYDLTGYTAASQGELRVLFRPGNVWPWAAGGVAVIALALAIALRARSRAARRGQGPAAVAEPGGAALEVAAGPGTGTVYLLRADVTRIGRSADKNDVKVEGPTASRQHAVIRKVGDRFVYEDIAGKNPTIINGHELAGPQELVSGDRIEVGDTILIFREGGA